MPGRTDPLPAVGSRVVFDMHLARLCYVLSFRQDGHKNRFYPTLKVKPREESPADAGHVPEAEGALSLGLR
jgi:hypothetical protein